MHREPRHLTLVKLDYLQQLINTPYGALGSRGAVFKSEVVGDADLLPACCPALWGFGGNVHVWGWGGAWVLGPGSQPRMRGRRGRGGCSAEFAQVVQSAAAPVALHVGPNPLWGSLCHSPTHWPQPWPLCSFWQGSSWCSCNQLGAVLLLLLSAGAN